MRRTLLSAATALLLGAGLAGCGAPASPLRPVGEPAARAGAAAAAAGEADTSCNPRASLRPTGPLPAAGRMPAGSFMADIRRRGKLVLGTSQDTLLFGARNSLTGRIEGFDVDMGRQIADAILGSPDKIQIKVLPYAQRIEALEKGDVDLVIQTMTVNCERAKRVDFSTVYYEAGQKVLVPATSKAQRIEDLGGKRVCSATGSTSLDTLARVKPPVEPVGLPTFGDCLVAFQLGEVDAVSTDDTILAGMAAQDPYAKVVGPRFTEEPYGIAVAPTHPEFTRFVNAVLEQNRRDGTWAATYTKWLGKFGPAPKPPVAQYK